MRDLFLVVFILALVVVLLAVTPLAFLWSVNSLFGLSIPYSLKSVFAAWVLLFVVRIVARTQVDHEAFRR